MNNGPQLAIPIVVSLTGLVLMWMYGLQPGRGSLACETEAVCNELAVESQALLVDFVWVGVLLSIAVVLLLTYRRHHATH